MANTIGIRLEDKNGWERRVSLIPEDAAKLVARGIDIQVQRSPNRIFEDTTYQDLNVPLVDDVRPADIVIGVKEMPISFFRPGGAYMFFSHTIKGQPYNMKMLATLVENKCTLLDYELVTDDDGRRLIFFGRYAGLAGMIDTLWTLGKRLEVLGYQTPFLGIKPAHTYSSLKEAKAAVQYVGSLLEAQPLPSELTPMVFGVTGYGNVSLGAGEIISLLPYVDIAPEKLGDFVANNKGLRNKVGKVVFKEEHLVERKDQSAPFQLEEYYQHGERYRSTFAPKLQHLSVLVNGIYWDERYPKLADQETLKRLYESSKSPKLTTVGDITCDIDGSLACTVRDTEPGDPVFVYNPANREAPSGFSGPGIAVMAVGNLPTELPREASETFSNALFPYIPEMANADLSQKFEDVQLPEPIRRSVILWRGQFTPKYEYMREFLQ